MNGQRGRCVRGLVVGTAVLAAAVLATSLSAAPPATEAQWVWSPDHQKGSVPQAACSFRKTFTVAAPESGEIAVAADDEYELYVNGQRVGSSQTANRLDQYDISKHLTRGRNLVALRVTNTEGGTAGVAVEIRIKEQNGGTTTLYSDPTWLSNLRPLPFWYSPLYNDSRWAAAQSFGRLVRYDKEPPRASATATAGPAKPPSGEPALAPSPRSKVPASRPAEPPPSVASKLAQPAEQAPAEQAPAEEELQVKVNPEFEVDRVLPAKDTGSLNALTFNEFGHVIAAREKGPLLLMYDSDKDGEVDQVRTYGEQVKNCQGLLCLNGDVYVTGEGPDGIGLYRLVDENRDGRLDKAETLLKFRVPAGSEYGPHGLALGTDGWLYVAVGHQTQVEKAYASDSPYAHAYEGDLLQPRYEDPDGQEPPVKAPGGAILRTDLKGATVQLVAGGLRNPRDLRFTADGDLFTADDDADRDVGLPWYRPARLLLVTPGAEFGWRSGWAKWPDYFADSLPAVFDTGRSRPSGIVCYRHYLFPERYQHALFLADWQHGRILTIQLQPQGAGFTTTSELFFESTAFRITDLDVGPDGHLYFVNGGQDTAGGLYRIRWTGKPSPAVTNLGRGLSAVVRAPQLDTAWSRQQVAAIKTQIGTDWDRLIRGVAMSSANPWRYRTRALELLQLYGPAPPVELLIQLSQADVVQVRAKAAELMGLHADGSTRAALVSLLEDGDARIRRQACEALVRAGQTAPVDKLTKLLQSEDRREAFAARRLLERLPPQEWREKLLASDQPRVVIQASLALLTAQPNPEHALAVVQRAATLMDEYVSDRDFLDLLRVVQVALVQGPVAREDAAGLRGLLVEEFPAKDPHMNRELIRLLVHLQASAGLERYLEYLTADEFSEVERLHAALQLRFLETGWTAESRTKLLEFLEDTQKKQSGRGPARYLLSVSRDFAKGMGEDEARQIVAEGHRWPTAALGALYRLPQQLDAGLRDTILQLDQRLKDGSSLPERRLKVGLVAVLARSGDAESLTYLRGVWERDPERRPAIAVGLAQYPNEENWPYLVRSLTVLEGDAAREVLTKLRSVDLAPEEPEYFRQVIVCGLKLRGPDAAEALALLEYWAGEKPRATATDEQAKLAAWQRWFAQRWPDQPPAVLPEDAEPSRWKVSELLKHLNSAEATAGSASRGALVFEKALCAKCHRCGALGPPEGLDLTGLSQRAMRKEILEALLYPSAVIPPTYAVRTVVTAAGHIHAGAITVNEAGDATVRTANAAELTVPHDQIDQLMPCRVSEMPSGLLDPLSLQEVTDLVHFLNAPPETLVTKGDKETVRR